MLNYFYPILSGLCGSLAGYAGKIAFSSEPHYFDLYFMENIIAFLLMLNFNKFMFQFLFKSFNTNGSSITTLISFVSNNALNAVNGYFFLNEIVTFQWSFGMFLLMIGVVLIAQEQDKIKKE